MTVTRFLSTALAAILTALFGFTNIVSAATPRPSVNNDTVAFTKEGLWLENIWRLNIDSSQLRPLTHLGGRDPLYSPNGKQVVFSNPLSNRLQVMRSNGSGVHGLTSAPGHFQESMPAWSRDGSRITFVRERVEAGRPVRAILVSDVNGTGERVIAGWSSTLKYRSPSWSPDGKQIVYEQTDGTTADLRIADVQTQTASQLVGLSDVTDIRRVSWSPDGKKILFNDSANEVYTIWPDGTHRSILSDGDSYDASWSPDGRSVIFLESHTGEGISVSGPDGTVTQVPVEQGVYQEIGVPIWSPDGRSVLFAMTNTAGSKPVADLFKLDLQNPTNVVKVAQNIAGGYDWQPNL